jgi:hypothetical protein
MTSRRASASRSLGNGRADQRRVPLPNKAYLDSPGQAESSVVVRFLVAV